VLDQLDILVGEWEMQAGLAGEPPFPGTARTTFEWLRGRQFLIERWEVPSAFDGIAIIGPGDADDAFRRHYYDGRGVHRIYEMTLADGLWRQWRDASDPFPQRFEGRIEDGGNTIIARWDKAEDDVTWAPDIDVIYRRISSGRAS
jgi:hypothetical protein